MTDPTEQELEQLLDDIFIAHEDNDSFTCNANYTTCTECHQRYYYLSWLPCSHNAKQRIVGECNCSLKQEKAEAKAALLAWRDRAVRVELECVQAMLPRLSSYDGQPHPLTKDTHAWLAHRIKALPAEPKEEV